MPNLKYIISDRGAFVVFNGQKNHPALAQCLHGKPVSAGALKITSSLEDTISGRTSIQIECSGSLPSIGLSSRGEVDENILTNNFSI